jgi:CRP-like cAMP-binding protein
MFYHRRPTAAATANGAIPPEALRRVKILAEMSDEDLTRFLSFMEVQTARQWTPIVRQGERGDSMFLVLDGEVRVRLLIDNKETTLVTLGPGDFFGEVSLFDQGPRSADVIANSDAVLLKICHKAFANLSQTAPELAAPVLIGIGKTLTARIRADNKRLRDTLVLARASH